MNNETQPTPKQLAKWREEAVRFYINSPIDHEYLGHSDYYINGYLRSQQEGLQAMKLIEKAANISAQHARKQALEEAYKIYEAAQELKDVKRGIQELLNGK